MRYYPKPSEVGFDAGLRAGQDPTCKNPGFHSDITAYGVQKTPKPSALVRIASTGAVCAVIALAVPIGFVMAMKKAMVKEAELATPCPCVKGEACPRARDLN